MTTVADVRLRGILDSRGEPTIEAEVELASGAWGRGSCPRAIAPGRREPARVGSHRLGRASSLLETRLQQALRRAGRSSQAGFDAALRELASAFRLGADATLALSLAFWRASCAERGQPPHQYVAELAGTEPALPRPLVNVFSGGIHLGREARSFQQIMFGPKTPGVVDDIEAALRIFAAVERRLLERGTPFSLSASSGFVVPGASDECLLAELRSELRRTGSDEVAVGVDVAAEHLRNWDGTYRLGSERLHGSELLARLENLALAGGLAYVEDPFAPDDAELWRQLLKRVGERTLIVGDDLFVSSRAYLDRGLANAVLVKPSQAGTLTATLETARAAREAGLALCLSHRSGETEDVAICDLAAALGARFVKLGGPRRGDRIGKYNQLLRLAETVPTSVGSKTEQQPHTIRERSTTQ